MKYNVALKVWNVNKKQWDSEVLVLKTSHYINNDKETIKINRILNGEIFKLNENTDEETMKSFVEFLDSYLFILCGDEYYKYENLENYELKIDKSYSFFNYKLRTTEDIKKELNCYLNFYNSETK
jgi:hypothetical protein